jgi:hypothetical protein
VDWGEVVVDQRSTVMVILRRTWDPPGPDQQLASIVEPAALFDFQFNG